MVNTCCTTAKGSACYIRLQSQVSAAVACEIPDCDDLASDDATRMASFVPLTTTDGQGKQGNFYPTYGQGGAAALHVSPLLVGLTATLAAGVCIV